ncbi:MAG: Cof-type HAD-IIB family hydrolase [Clostridia bacterium]
MKYKMICSDLDDTLLDSDRNISDELISSITRYVDNGGKFVVATGRMTMAALPIARRLGLHGEILTFQGARINDIDSGKALNCTLIPNEDAIKICEYIETTGHYFHTYIDDYFVTEKESKYTKMYANLCKCTYKICGIPLSECVKINNYSPPKIVIFADPTEIGNVIRDMQEKFGDKYLINTSKPWLVEIINKNINKALGVAYLAKKYNIKQEEIICIGDSSNDALMLEYAGLGVAVGNCTMAAKRVADVICPSCDENGVGWVIDNYGFIK